MSRTVIVDYGMANLRSVQKAFEQVGHAAVITSDPGRVGAAGKLVLPGVGAFRDAIATQFHPEKSQGVGQTMLRNFARL